MHPDQGDGDDGKQQPEAALPDAGQVVQRAEGDRQDEPAQSAHQPDHATDGADPAGIIDRDMLVDRGLAQAHEEAQHERHRHEAGHAHRQAEADRAMDALHHIGCGRIGQDEGADHRDREGPVHDPPRAELVRQMAAIGAKHRRRDGIGGAHHARGGDRQPVDADQIARQPQRQGHETAEDEEIIQREAPDLNVLQRLQHHLQALRLLATGAAAGQVRIVLGEQEEDDGHHQQRGGPDQGDRFPAKGDHDGRRGELGDRGAHIAGAEDAERGALLFLRIPFGHIGHAHREGAAGKADAQGGEQEGRVVIGLCQQHGHHRGRQHRERENDAPAILIGPDAEDQPDQRPGQDRGADEQAELRLGQAQILLDLDADDGEQGPDGEAGGKRDGGKPKCPALVSFALNASGNIGSRHLYPLRTTRGVGMRGTMDLRRMGSS